MRDEHRDQVAGAIFEAGLPRGKNGTLTPGHTEWADLGPQAQERHRRMADAAVDKLRDVGWEVSYTPVSRISPPNYPD